MAGPCAVSFRSGTFMNSRSQKLYTVQYAPVGRTPKALVFVHHGLAEHIGRYDNVLRRLAGHGLAVFGFDAHGHGKSQPQAESSRAFVQSYVHLVEDFEGYVQHVLSQQSNPCVVMFSLGHSMGGLVAALAALRNQKRWSGLMLHSPAVDVEWTAFLRVQAVLGSLLSLVTPYARLVPAVRPEDMSQDPRVVRGYVEDPLNFVGPVRTRTANELLKAFHLLNTEQHKLQLPLYVCHGDHDRCTSFSASERLVAGVSSKDKVFRPVIGGYHELLHGPEWEECTDAIANWINAHLGITAVAKL